MSALTLQTEAAAMQAHKLPALSRGAEYTPEKAREVANEFEAVFLSQMLQPMFEGLEAEAPFGGGSAEKMWRNLQVDEYGKALAKNGGIGIADAVMTQLLQLQETN